MKKADTTRKYVTTKKYNKLVEHMELLQEQLNKADEVIKLYAETMVGHKQKDGTYGFWLCSGDVAFDNPLERINNKMKYTCYDPRPAKKYLEKWGVK